MSMVECGVRGRRPHPGPLPKGEGDGTLAPPTPKRSGGWSRATARINMRIKVQQMQFNCESKANQVEGESNQVNHRKALRYKSLCL